MQRLDDPKGRHEKPWYLSTIHAFLTHDVPRLSGLPAEALRRDIHTLDKRLSAEGESFLTKTLPAFGAAIDAALQGNVPLITTAFKKAGRGCALPAFLHGLTRRIFLDSGWVMERPCTTSIRLVRQLCFWCKKIQKGYSDESLQKAIHDFIEVDRNLPDRGEIPRDGVLGCARAIMEDIFHDIRIDFKPRHGPGAVASGDDVVGKRHWAVKFPELEAVFRPVPYFYTLGEIAEDPRIVTDRPVGSNLSRTEFVEKDSSGPRTIGLEPAAYMWCQQSVKSAMYHHIERRSSAKGHVNFTDQEVNRNLTFDWEQFATLDMSKASDRNSLALVEELFQNTKLWPYLLASRTPGTVLPNKEVLFYKKFAPMGSATCFPVQACVYYTLACATMHVVLGVPLFIAQKKVYVYGDDLVVPRYAVQAIFESFERYSLKFNSAKCCTHGKFRESCGMDAFDGVEVTPIRLRKAYQSSLNTDSFYRSLTEHSNELMSAGYAASAVNFRNACYEKYPFLSKLKLPVVNVRVPIIHWYEPMEELKPEYKYKDSQRFIQGYVIQPKEIGSQTDAEERFYHEVLSRGGTVGSKIEPESIRMFALRYKVVLKKRTIACPEATCKKLGEELLALIRGDKIP